MRSRYGRFFALCLAFTTLSACQFKVKPTFQAAHVAQDLQKMCQKDYHLSIQTRLEGKSLQALFWTVGLVAPGQTDMSAATIESLERVLLCATRIALSTDAAMDFIEVKMVDGVTGATVTVWRYVPDVQDSMHTRIGEEEYFNRLVFDVKADPDSFNDGHSTPWDAPITLPKFLGKQIVQRAKRLSTVGLQAHEDLSTPATLTVVIDNWDLIEQEGPKEKASVEDQIGKAAKTVLSGYSFKGFHGLIVQDDRGSPVGRLSL